jgi:hypothetical protein
MWTAKTAPRPEARLGTASRRTPAARPASCSLLGRGLAGFGAAEDEAAEQLDHVDRALGELDPAVGRDQVLLGARLERDEVAAQEAVGQDPRRAVGRQLDGLVDPPPCRS